MNFSLIYESGESPQYMDEKFKFRKIMLNIFNEIRIIRRTETKTD